ncbi:MAG: sigma-70 family RNA polymerase sigma factor [Solirubrobacterales bacterium]
MSGDESDAGISAPDDIELVARCQTGDVVAFELLVRKYSARLVRLLRGYLHSEQDADDVAQEAFVRAWRGIKSFRGASGFYTWLVRIAINEANRHLKKRARIPAPGTVDGERVDLDAADWRPGPEGRLLRADLLRQLERAVLALPVKYRAPVVLRDIEGMSTTEAAAIIGVSEAAFKSRLHRGRLLLRRTLGDALLDESGESR